MSRDGVLEALTMAKQQGKVRFVGFTGHKNPSIHLEMLHRGFKFDTVQMPINPFDPGFRSFEQQVLPVAVQKGMAVFGMKSMGGSGEPIVHGILTPTEALSYAMSVPGGIDNHLRDGLDGGARSESSDFGWLQAAGCRTDERAARARSSVQ